MIIVGAGLGGLIAATQFPQAAIFEKEERVKQYRHSALLRFRSDVVAKATGIEFKKVRVHKAVWDGSVLKSQPSIIDMNKYSAKVIGSYSQRSIGDCSSVDRWIAPSNLHETLVERMDPRIQWGCKVSSPLEFTGSCPVISTIPITVLNGALGDNSPAANVDFPRSPIKVIRMKLDKCDIYQTVYDASHSPLYRISITGDTLIAEYVEGVCNPNDAMNSLELFGISKGQVIQESTQVVDQNYGKISTCSSENRRKALIVYLTTNHNIYSLGRFATWRNILLDDYINDIEQIRHMIVNGSYHLHLRRK